MSYNPFRSHSRKEQERQRLMKINKPASMTDISMTFENMKKAMEELNKEIEKHRIADVLVGVLNSYPNPMVFGDHFGGPALDTESFKFNVRTLIEVWDAFPVPSFIERHFNEAEDIDQHYLNALIASMNPDTVLSMDMLMGMFTAYFDKTYPAPTPDMFHSFNGVTMEQKDYFLPGLKVLNIDSNGILWSPVYYVPWYNNELKAGHLIRSIGGRDITFRDHTVMETAMRDCDCGIYASVNLEELKAYFVLPENQSRSLGMDDRFQKYQRRLCIIEPTSDATMWMARKGWKSSHAFISEIVGQTISIKDASELLSMVWHRHLNLSTLFHEEYLK